MKIDKNITVVGGLLAVLLAASVSVSGAATIITDDFSNPVGPLTAGDTLAPTYSAAGTGWTVESGSYTTVGGQIITGEGAGQLGSGTNSSVVRLDFGDVEDNTGATVSFGLRQWNGAAITTAYTFQAEVGDSTTGQSYTIVMALSPAYFGAQGGGATGFSISDPTTGNLTASGIAGQYIGNTGSSFYQMAIAFDPTTGLSVTRDGGLVASWNGVASGMTKIDYLKLNTTSASLVWYMDNVSVDAVLVPEPSTWMLLGLGFGAVVLLRRRKSVA